MLYMRSFKLFHTDINDIDLTKIRIKKPFVLFQQYDFDIAYDDDNHQFLIQTPLCMFYNNIMKDTKSIIIDITSSNDTLEQTISKISNTIQERMLKCVPSIIKNKPFIAPLKSRVLRLKNKDRFSILAFDENNNPIDIDDITRNDKVILIFQVEKVIIYSD